MATYLRLVLEAPLLSFGGVATSGTLKPTDPMPGRSMITGLLANALGVDRREVSRLQTLQDGLKMAALVQDGQPILTDFQTTDIKAPGMTQFYLRGKVRARGGAEGNETNITKKQYLQGSAIVLVDAASVPGEIVAALQRPKRPLYLGRKCCVPSRPVFDGTVEAASFDEAARESVKGAADTYTLYQEGEGGTLSYDRKQWAVGTHHGGTPLIRTTIRSTTPCT